MGSGEVGTATSDVIETEVLGETTSMAVDDTDMEVSVFTASAVETSIGAVDDDGTGACEGSDGGSDLT